MITQHWLTPKKQRLTPHDRRSRVFIRGRSIFLAWHPLRPHGIYAAIERNETGTWRDFAIGRLYAGFGRGIPTP